MYVVVVGDIKGQEGTRTANRREQKKARVRSGADGHASRVKDTPPPRMHGEIRR